MCLEVSRNISLLEENRHITRKLITKTPQLLFQFFEGAIPQRGNRFSDDIFTLQDDYIEETHLKKKKAVN